MTKHDACLCNDCGVDVVKAGEYYMLSADIWERTLRLTWADNLCIGCLESRLGRKLSFDDFITWHATPTALAIPNATTAASLATSGSSKR